MKILRNLIVATTAIVLACPIFAAVNTDDSSSYKEQTKEDDQTIMLAKKKKKKKKKKKGGRERHIIREGRQKSKDKSSIDFDAVDIGGQRKTPMGSLITKSKADKNYDFVKIRLRWHPEMIQSASSLQTGQTK